jgi:hypothetical protein
MKSGFALAAILLATVAIAATASAAGPSKSATGTDTVDTLTVTSTRQADSNAVQEGIITGHLTGTISGTYVAQYHWVVHPSGQLEAHVTGLVNGTSPCGSGAMPFRTDTAGTFAAYAGTHEGIDNADNTAHTATHFELVGSGLNLTYTGTYRCLS